jgi:tRNA1Val (adenine37-N6)-methyltransferase
VSTRSGTLLGGRVRHAQADTGHRTGIEPVLLAASIAARPGSRVLEGGTGTGAALLCLATRIPGITGVGIERDSDQAALARQNMEANGLHGLEIVTADLTAPGALPAGLRFDHAMANPPWHHSAGTASSDLRQELARRARHGLFGAWIAALARPLRDRGSLTLVTSAASLPDCIAGLAAAGCGSITLLPLWPKAGREAKLILLQAVKSGRGPARLLPGLVLHADGGNYTPAVELILREGAGLDWNVAGEGS